jgi:hypothetical protein
MRNRDLYEQMDQDVKLGDIAAYVSVLLNTPFPFSNMGKMHPLLAQTDDIKAVHRKFLANVRQQHDYLTEYCRLSQNLWCPDELKTSQAKMDEFEDFEPEHEDEREITKQLAAMSQWASD